MQKFIALMLIFSLSVDKSLYAMDFELVELPETPAQCLKMDEALVLLQSNIKDNVHPLDGYWDANSNSCNCHLNAIILTVLCGFIGISSLVVASIMTGIAHVDRRQGTGHLWFDLGMAFWG